MRRIVNILQPRRCTSIAVAAGVLLAASVNSPAADFNKGRRLFIDQQWAEAETELLDVLEASPGNGDASALLGMTLYHQDRYADSLPRLNQAVESGTRYASRVLYYLGLTHSKLGNRDEAKDSFASLLVKHPDSEEARRLAGVEPEAIEAASETRGYEVSGTILSIAAGLDSNPALTDDGNSDQLAAVYLSTDVSLGDLPVQFGGSLFFETYFDDSENNFWQAALDAGRDFQLSANSMLETSGQASQSWLDGDAFEREFTLSAEHSRAWSRLLRTEVRGRLTIFDALGDATSDGDELSLRMRAYRYLERQDLLQRLRFELELRQDDRDESFLASDSVELGIQGRLDLPRHVTLDLALDYEMREYDGASPFTGRTRDDDTIELSAYLLKPLDATTYLTLDGTLVSRDSNVDFYSADELRILFGLLWVP